MRWAPQVILYLKAVNTKAKCVGKVASIRYSSRTVAIEDYLLLEHAVFFVKKKLFSLRSVLLRDGNGDQTSNIL
jgi:hypothetical protein